MDTAGIEHPNKVVAVASDELETKDLIGARAHPTFEGTATVSLALWSPCMSSSRVFVCVSACFVCRDDECKDLATSDAVCAGLEDLAFSPRRCHERRPLQISTERREHLVCRFIPLALSILQSKPSRMPASPDGIPLRPPSPDSRPISMIPLSRCLPMCSVCARCK